MVLPVSVLLNANPQAWVSLEETLAHLAKDMDEAAEGLYARGTGALPDAWADAVGELAKTEFIALAASFEIVGIQLRSACSVLSGMAVTMITCRRETEQWMDAASWKQCTVADDGMITPPDDAPESVAEWASTATHALRSALMRATKADAAAAEVLRNWRLVTLDVNRRDGIDVGGDVKEHLRGTLPLGTGGALDALKAGVPVAESDEFERRWWAGLTDAERSQLMKALPLTVAGLSSLPPEVREKIRGEGGYDRVKMLHYASDHWADEKGDWKGLDNCTNFVSHTLEAGGLSQKGWTPWGAESWGHTVVSGVDLPLVHYKGQYSDTWGGADQQHDFFATHGSESVGVAGAEPGDTIYWTHTTESTEHSVGEEHHAAVVSAVLPNGDVLYTQHSDGAQHLSLNGRLPRSDMGGDQEIQVLRIRKTW